MDSRPQTWQGGLTPPSLDTGHFALDERDRAAMISLLADLSRLVAYDDGDSLRTDGWSGVWADDLTFLLAEICQVDAPSEYARNRSLGSEALTEAVRSTVARIETWRARARLLPGALTEHGVEAALYTTLDEAISKELGPSLQDGTLEPRGQFSLSPMVASGFWEQRTPVELELAYSTANRTTGRLVTVARDYLDRALSRKSDHPPHAGLALGILDSFRHLQADLAGLTERHLLYHYKSLLKLAPRDAVPDRVALVFDLAPGTRQLTLPEDMRFSAHVGDGHPALNYRLLRQTQLAAGQLAAVTSMRIARRVARPSDDGPPIRWIRSIRAAAQDVTTRWHPFGHKDMPDVPIGCIMRDRVLDLAGGTRQILAHLRFDPNGRTTLSTALRRFRQQARVDMGAKGGKSALRFLGRNAFAARLGDLPLVIDRVASRGDTLMVKLSVPDNAPPMAGAGLTLQLAPLAPVFAASAMDGLVLQHVDLEVAVSGLRDLTADANGVPLDLTAPAPIFGPQPVPGAALTVEAAELAGKTVTALALNLCWEGLPADPAMWRDVFAPYGEDLDITSFAADMAWVDGSDWTATPAAPLFAIQQDGRLARRRGWSLAGRDLGGRLRLRLTAPKTGFGQMLYPNVLARAAMRETGWRARWFGSSSPADLPLPPPVPLASDVSLTYTATARVTPGPDLALLPLGGDARLWPDETAGGLRLDLPTADALLLLGFDGIDPPAPLSMLVDIDQSNAPQWHARSGFPRPRLVWQFRDGTHWRPLPEDALGKDDTRGLVAPGVVSFRLPHDIAGQRAWLAAAIEGDPDRYAYMNGLHLRAAMVERVMEDAGHRTGPPDGTEVQSRTEPVARPDDTDRRPATIAAGTIRAPASTMPGLAALRQPMPSAGGRPPETEAAFRTRVSGRLRHRGRAITAQDYERLVLDNFENVSQARLSQPEPGKMVLAVAPVRVRPVSGAPPEIPMIERYDIWKFLTEHAAPGVNLSVRSPQWEPLQVQARVLPASGAPSTLLGELERLLVDHIAPWVHDPDAPMEIGNGACDADTLQSILTDHPRVARVDGVGLLHAFAQPAEDAALIHGLKDTARGGRARIACAKPWSVLVPQRPLGLSYMPYRRGIGDLAVGVDLHSFSPKARDRYTADPHLIPIAPRRYGHGSLRIGSTYVLTDPEDAIPPQETTR